MEAFNFEDELVQGRIGEAKLSEMVGEAILGYESHPDIQRSGIDLVDDAYRWDVKTQSHKYIFTSNIPIEVFSSFEDQSVGWFYKTHSDIIVWLYLDANGTGVWHRGYVMFMTDALVEFVEEYRENWRRIEVSNDGRYGEYTAVNYLIPVTAFPSHMLVPFNPLGEGVEAALP
jgi:hypothetical protein